MEESYIVGYPLKTEHKCNVKLMWPYICYRGCYVHLLKDIILYSGHDFELCDGVAVYMVVQLVCRQLLD